MGDVPVAAHKYIPPLGSRGGQQGQEIIHEAEFGFLPLGGARPGGEVKGYDGKLAEIGTDEAAFGIEFAVAHALDEPVRLFPTPQADAAVAFLFRAVVVGVKAVGTLHFGRQVSLLGLDFLQTDDVSLLRFQPRKQTLVPGGTDAVEI